jgi:hypothetical protein
MIVMTAVDGLLSSPPVAWGGETHGGLGRGRVQMHVHILARSNVLHDLKRDSFLGQTSGLGATGHQLTASTDNAK